MDEVEQNNQIWSKKKEWAPITLQRQAVGRRDSVARDKKEIDCGFDRMLAVSRSFLTLDLPLPFGRHILLF
jgi:hypothetical protein|nr:hypothetical protein Q903MT_gene2240 [Picea sitchensis]